MDMADVASIRSVEDFLINPTYAAMEPPGWSMKTPKRFGSNAKPPTKVLTLNAGKKTAGPSATIGDLRDEHSFLRGYASEEEVASPVGLDDMSTHSSQESLLVSEASFPKQLAYSSYTAEQQYGQAKAVTLVSAGKAKVISMPKLVHEFPTRRAKRASVDTIVRPTTSRMHPVEVASRTSSPHSRADSRGSSSERSHISTAPSSPQPSAHQSVREKILRRRPSLPSLHISRQQGMSDASAPSKQPHLMRAADFLKYDPYPSADLTKTPGTPPTPTSPSRRRLGKMPATFNLSRLVRKGSSESSSGPDMESVKEPEPVLYSKAAPILKIPTRRSSTRRRLVARGANEREPPLILPPCPEHYESDHDYSLASHWPPRKDSTTVHVTIDPATKMPRLHTRQRSMSAALVSAQA